MSITLDSLLLKKFCTSITALDKLVLKLIAINLAVAIYFVLLNLIFTRYQGNFYIPILWLWLLPVMLALFIVAVLTYNHAPRITFFTRSYALYLFLLLSFAALATGAQYTPFLAVDRILAKIDYFLGFSTPAVMTWTLQHPSIKILLEYCYDFLDIELFVLPLAAAWFKDKLILDQYFVMASLSFLTAIIIYYFLPTSAPVSVFHHIAFLPQEHFTAIKFYEIHHYLPVTVHDTSLIAFPSMHVVWSLLLIYLVRKHIWLCLPIFAINLLIIASTLFLGWHYLTDVIGGFAVAALSIYLANQLCAQALRKKI